MRKALIASGATLAIGTALLMVAYQNWLHQLYNRFPNYDRKIVRETYRSMLSEALRGNLPMAQDMTDTEMDALFIKQYNARRLHAV